MKLRTLLSIKQDNVKLNKNLEQRQ